MVSLIQTAAYSKSEFVDPSLRNLSFLNTFDEKTHEITTRYKTFKKEQDKVFIDGYGREVTFRGWNMCGDSKNSKFGFKPWADQEDAKNIIDGFHKETGSNIVRWLFTWEGAQPEVDVISEKYFDEQVLQIKEAIKKKIYVFIDFHQDTFSKHIPGGSNGAPKWVVEGMKNLPEPGCGKGLGEKLCKIGWSVHYVLNKGVIKGLENFWNNIELQTPKGPRKIQDEYLKMVEFGLKKIKSQLTEDEFKYIVGLDIFNEPHYGGFTRRAKTKKWLNEQLFPFYEKTVKLMKKTGWNSKFFFGEPHMMWNLKLPVTFQVGSGTGLLNYTPKGNWVFNYHFYDETRESMGITKVKNGGYLRVQEKAIKESRNWDAPLFASEFGTWPIGGSNLRKESADPSRNLKAAYQALELRKRSTNLNRYADFYSPFTSTTQWTWEKNVGGARLKDELTTGRVYPKRTQGELMTFFYNDNVKSYWKGTTLDWNAIAPKSTRKRYFRNRKFAISIWRGRTANAPTEISLPRHFDLSKTVLITDKKIVRGIKDLSMNPTFKKNEVLLTTKENAPSTLYVYDDPDKDESASTYHFILVGELNDLNELSDKDLQRIQKQMIKRIAKEKSPIIFNGYVRQDNPLIK